MGRPLPDGQLAVIRRNVALYRLIPEELKPELHGHIQNFLAEKHFEGCGGLALTEEMRVTIAAQACMLLLRRRSTYFPKCDSVIVYPSAYVAGKRSRFGYVETEEASVRLGESWTQGLVVLAWDEVAREAAHPDEGRNVVLHEFAHQLDQEDGAADGTPILGSRSAYPEWSRVMGGEYAKLRDRAFNHVHDVLDAYGATNEAEFFAVATEAFFNRGKALKYKHPELYGLLEGYYRLDPAEWVQR
ncbi:MAG: zinc-dependent peptidase [Proteobacteria bacterium]|nr:zinc-dependent peptidase [Pseudomonadota bacterium]